MRRSETGSAAPTLGVSTLFVVFGVLCLTVFAMLSLITVRSNGKLSATSSDAVRAYYEADRKAEEILAQLREGAVPDGVETDGGSYVYSCKISDSQQLQVRVAVAGSTYRVEQWQVKSSYAWETTPLIPVASEG